MCSSTKYIAKEVFKITANELLKKYFGYDSFRTGQDVIIEKILNKKDVLGIMPTGAGKSICYQIPAMCFEGVTIVVSPLISLMKDQVDSLNQIGIPSTFVNSTLSSLEYIQTIENISQNVYKIIYVAPERLESEDFIRLINSINVSMFAIDEAHCVSQWGHDFRPSYREIANVILNMKKRPIVAAFTATATEIVKKDIINLLHLEEPFLLTTGFDRSNLKFSVESISNKSDYITNYLEKHKNNSGIIYCLTRKSVDSLHNMLSELGYSVSKYHAGMSDKERNKNQEDFVYDRTSIMIATNAFGMGIDKSNIRFVIHYNMPRDLESYYQEAGRAGRDGETAYAVLLFNPHEDKAKIKKRIVDTYPPKEFVEMVYHKTMDFLQIGAGSGLGHRFMVHIDELCHVMKLPVLQTYSALHILTQAGYIDFEEEHETQPRVQIKVPRHLLGEYNLSREQVELMDILMRSYSGIYTELQYVREADEPSKHEILVSLAQRGIITYIPRSVGCSLTMTKEREVDLYLSPAIFEERQMRFISKINAMLEYAEQNQFCREQVLLAYFGERDAVPCGHCDVCIAQ